MQCLCLRPCRPQRALRASERASERAHTIPPRAFFLGIPPLLFLPDLPESSADKLRGLTAAPPSDRDGRYLVPPRRGNATVLLRDAHNMGGCRVESLFFLDR